PRLSPMGYGFFHQKHHGLTLIGHGGDTLWFHTLLQLIPEKKLGLFVAYNTDSLGDARSALLQAFLDRYFPQPLPARAASPEGAHERARTYVGEYQTLRASENTLGKLIRLLSGTQVRLATKPSEKSSQDKKTTEQHSAPHAVLQLHSGERTLHLQEVEPGLYEELDGARRLAFRQTETGEMVLAWEGAAALSEVRVPWYLGGTAQQSLVAGCAGLLLTGLLFWPVVAFFLRGVQTPHLRRSRFSAFLSVLGWLMCLCLLTLLGFLLVQLSESDEVVFGLSPTLQLAFRATLLGAALVALTLLGALLAWIQGYWRWTGRLHYTLVALAGTGILWFFYYWNILPRAM
ncbi:MAG TPA: hypothetical protein PKD72_09845, partial [Gemmatales bacterium]|nr:hypothetical protein [Gemmatales bacterium]